MNKPMGGQEFIRLAQQLVSRDYNTKVIKLGEKLVDPADVYPVFLDKSLNNNKGTFATPENDGLYYEITRNGVTNEVYLDRYKKLYNECIPLQYFDEHNRLEQYNEKAYSQLSVLEKEWFSANEKICPLS